MKIYERLANCTSRKIGRSSNTYGDSYKSYESRSRGEASPVGVQPRGAKELRSPSFDDAFLHKLRHGAIICV